MKNQSIYLIVRVDIETPDNMSYEEVEELANELDYSFSLPNNCDNNVSVVNTEICGINE